KYVLHSHYNHRKKKQLLPFISSRHSTQFPIPFPKIDFVLCAFLKCACEVYGCVTAHTVWYRVWCSLKFVKLLRSLMFSPKRFDASVVLTRFDTKLIIRNICCVLSIF
ncbi:hypothetical protein Tcan_00620, partial [Toxocara canis]